MSELCSVVVSAHPLDFKLLRLEPDLKLALSALQLELLLAVLLTSGITAAVQAAYGEVDRSLIDDPAVGIYYGMLFGHVAVVASGILLIGQEYASGTVRASLAAVPRRGRFYAGKLLLGSGVGLGTGVGIGVGVYWTKTSSERPAEGTAAISVGGACCGCEK